MRYGIQVNQVGFCLSEHKKLEEIWISILDLLSSVGFKDYVVYKLFKKAKALLFL